MKRYSSIGNIFEEEDIFEILQYLLYIFNTIFFMVGAMIFAFGIYVTYHKSMGDYLGGLFMDFYYNATAVMMFTACLLALNAFIGCCAGFLTSRRGLFLHMGLICITFVLFLGTSIFMLENGLENTKLYPYIQVTMRDLIYKYQIETDARRSVDIIQENIGCCGGFGANDYIDIHLPVPDTCRDQTTGNQYGDSCAEVFSWFMEVRTGWMCGLALCTCFLEIFEMILCGYTFKFIKKLTIRRQIRLSLSC